VMVLAAWCFGMALVVAARRPRAAVWAWLGTTLLAVWHSHTLWGIVVSGAASGFLAISERSQTTALKDIRPALVRFWHKVEVMVSAGLTFWQAVEYAATSEPLIAASVRRVAEQIATRSRGSVAPDPSWGEDGDITVLMLQHGYLHGVEAGQIRTQVRYLEGAMRVEAENRRKRMPIWMSVLPAMLLLNVLWLFLAPMGAMAAHSWLRVS
jgi:hypothetical protein